MRLTQNVPLALGTVLSETQKFECFWVSFPAFFPVVTRKASELDDLRILFGYTYCKQHTKS
ncbi:hypothetical protein GCM10010911_68840 [Paenibacillus nasutitermitis]|uniref:Uncharacterized protein n=1 Tax=Paenibacillus nasutitermitis TaxID=1652958 RepID=A0A916ZJW3_9BACL|nr:hypothetical protein GCM10010911_68840 [Paenibacillus nasutitermitis]